MKIYVESGSFLWSLNQISELFWNDASKDKAIVVRVIGMYKLGQHVDISGEDTNESMAHFFVGSKLIGYPVFRLALATINSNEVNPFGVMRRKDVAQKWQPSMVIRRGKFTVGTRRFQRS
jgi:2-succinyl-5-enolpyruvyl-6-hydroxy-3-cyclohexene-1-carboxylate synthase